MSIKRKATEAILDATTKKPKQNAITSFFGKPTIVSSTTAASGPLPKSSLSTVDSTATAIASKFDKNEWLAKLTKEQKDLLKLEIDTLDPSWLAVLHKELSLPYFLDLKRFLQREAAANKTIYPPSEDIYSWSRHTPLHTVKAVILGQDPYHGANQAHGICFSVKPPTPPPPSLRNIFICLKNDYPDFKPPKSGLLTPWSDRGVLLLNTVLSVEAHKANSHAGKGWETFTQRVIDIVNTKRDHVVFICWGTPAKQKAARVNRTKHLVLESVHPSPLSAARGFFTSAPFLKTNRWLKEKYGEDGEIDWSLNVAPEEAGT